MKRLLALACLLLAHTSCVWAANPVFDQAVQNYKAKRYSQAIAGFQTFSQANPSDAMSHYYMALCYQGMNQMALAKQQYEWVSANARDPNLRSYAATGLSGLGKIKSTFTPSNSGPVIPASFSRPGSGAVSIAGRLKVIEFYTEW